MIVELDKIMMRDENYKKISNIGKIYYISSILLNENREL